MRMIVVALALAAALASGPAQAMALALEAPASASARLGAVRVALWLRNASDRPLRASLDPGQLHVALRDASGAVLPCDPPAPPRGKLTEIAPGQRASLLLDIGTRCRLEAPGAYAVEVAYAGPGGRAGPTSTALRVTRWVNPGPRPTARPGARSR